LGRRYRRLYDQVIDPDNLRRAYERAAKGKRSTLDYLVFKEHAEANLETLGSQLAGLTWSPQPARRFVVHEPKARFSEAPRFSDRVVHHALHAVIEPIFDATLLPTVFACRKNKGTHAGVRWVQSELRRHGYRYYLHTDFSAFFASVDRATLHRLYRSKITCPRTRWLLSRIIPPEGQGIPIGSLISQLSANVYVSPLDRYLHHELRVPFARYMDDIVVLGHHLSALRACRDEIDAFASEALGLRLSRWRCGPVCQGINFLGYRIWPTHKLLRRSSVTRAKHAIRRLSVADDVEALRRFLGSWQGHAGWADAYNLSRWLDEQHGVTHALRARRPKRRSPGLSATLDLG
jgi:RNA-directed DNA polymerase